MNTYDYYITPEEYAKATKNGINKKNLEKRVRNYGWDKKKAIETPLRNSIPKKFKILAKENGISINTFYQRMYVFKWNMYKAATEPIKNKKTIIANAIEKNRKYPKEYIEKAKANGIKEYNFRRRVREYGWSYEKAATTPI